ncbi:conserved protein of unknown function [Acidithiobacillus ferrivorans]|uniref:Uncharacterized protein n=1 Tax=Acidithiobacillus ferrivorans TaxID=160808 RepID=A0A060UUU8_9PROT|nr:hypothetical protein [Acidithiobacillus ferrivorans]CDQ10513.1 conserved hypothetical protein [Acidithiobacillus ferrivorans]SMH64542.1 conserved protein of unknown function [Acidithiobacillus ferrivorans]
MIANHKEKTPLREKLAAIGTLLLEIALLIFVVSLSMIVLNILGLLAAHFVLGYSLAWVKAHFGDLLFFGVIVATSLLLIGGMVWIVLQDEYRRILQRRISKW